MLVTLLEVRLDKSGALVGTPQVIDQQGVTASNRPQAKLHAERAIQADVDSVDDSLTSVARALAGRAEVRAGITGDRPAVRRLFEVVRVEAEAQSVPDLSITIYDARGTPRAWSGRPTELGQGTLHAGVARFADAGQAGLRLIANFLTWQP